MGTRADFYVGKGNSAEWIGSIAWDGYRDGIDQSIFSARTEAEFREAVDYFLVKRDDATYPHMGWPWPWDDSSVTDCSYWFADGAVWDALGYPNEFFCRCDKPEPDTEVDGWSKGLERVEYPNMADRKKVTYGERSGVIFIGMKCDESGLGFAVAGVVI